MVRSDGPGGSRGSDEPHSGGENGMNYDYETAKEGHGCGEQEEEEEEEEDPDLNTDLGSVAMIDEIPSKYIDLEGEEYQDFRF